MQKHSINSLLEHNEMILPAEGERRDKNNILNCASKQKKSNFLIKISIALRMSCIHEFGSSKNGEVNFVANKALS